MQKWGQVLRFKSLGRLKDVFEITKSQPDVTWSGLEKIFKESIFSGRAKRHRAIREDISRILSE